MTVKSESEVAQSCLTLCDPMDCSLPGSSIHGIFQARVLEWGAIVFSDFIAQELHLISYITYKGKEYKKYIYIHTHIHTHVSESLCCTPETNTF